MSEIGTPSAAFRPHYEWLPTGSTDVEIQAALNDPWIYGVFLDPAGVFAINANLVVPNGKFLSGSTSSSELLEFSRPTLVLASGVNIQAPFSQLKYLNVTWEESSGLPAVFGTAATCEFVIVSSSGAASPMPAFQGSFDRLYCCSVQNMSGVEITSSPGSNQFGTKIEYLFVNAVAAGSFGYRNSAGAIENVTVTGLYTRGVDIGLDDNGGTVWVRIEDCTFTSSAVAGMRVSNLFEPKISNIKVYGSMGTGVEMTFMDRATIDGITVNDVEAIGISISDCTGIKAVNMSVNNGRGEYGIYMNGLVACTVNNLVVMDHFHNAPGSAIFTRDLQGGSFANYSVNNASGDDSFDGITVRNATGGSFANFNADQIQGIGIYITTCTGIAVTDLSSNGSFARTGIYIYENYSSTFTSMAANSNFRDGLETDQNTDCTFTTIVVKENRGNGVTSVNSVSSIFSSIIASSNGADGILAGNNCSFDNWSGVSAISNGAIGFNGINPGSSCNIDGLFTRGNVGLAWTFGPLWVTSNLVAV